ncbi:MAG: aquaporin Z [Taibaiella sp.]|nr:aquaporin Z [Taibaiella sp.]
MRRKLLAEFTGTFWLVFAGCGSAVFAAGIPGLGIGIAGVALAFGLSVLTMAYAVGHISGGHFNPAVTLGLAIGKRFPPSDILPYILAQCLGAVTAAACLHLLLNEAESFSTAGAGAFATNFYGMPGYSGRSYSISAAFFTEFLLTAFFLIIIMGATAKQANSEFAGIIIGLALTLIHMVSIPITNTSVNPARSLAQALFVGGAALAQLWLFFIAPLLGGATGALVYRLMEDMPDD